MRTLRQVGRTLVGIALYANPVCIIATTGLCGLLALALLPGLAVGWYSLVQDIFSGVREVLAGVPGRL